MKRKYNVIRTNVVDLEGNKLAEAGQEISPEFLEHLYKFRPATRSSKLIWQYPKLKEDFLEFCANPPYNKIFETDYSREQIINLLGRAKIFPIVYDSLMYFREHDFYTYRHTLMVSALSTRIADDCATLYRHTLEAATVTPSHDIGKITIPLKILIKQEPLTPDEIRIVREHATAGFIILTYHVGDEDPLACQVAYEHHELMDGRGYPRKIRESSELVQLVTVCDIFDALVMPRPYREQNYSIRAALDLMCMSAYFKKLNWEFVKLLISYNRLGRPSSDKLAISKLRREKEPRNNKYSQNQVLTVKPRGGPRKPKPPKTD